MGAYVSTEGHSRASCAASSHLRAHRTRSSHRGVSYESSLFFVPDSQCVAHSLDGPGRRASTGSPEVAGVEDAAKRTLEQKHDGALHRSEAMRFGKCSLVNIP